MWPDKPFDYIKVNGDDTAIHYGLFRDNKLISVISLFLSDKEAQFRKFATLEEEQGKGFGSQLLNYTLEQARLFGAERVWCNARSNKNTFYQKFGLKETASRFTKGGKDYVIMEVFF
nr:GNAT family N-acetyltransferase [Amphibacillus xylanus]